MIKLIWCMVTLTVCCNEMWFALQTLRHNRKLLTPVWAKIKLGDRQLEQRKKRFGDRRDGYLIRDIDPMHYITPIIYPGRCDNEAYISERIDITNINNYINKKNETETEFKYTLFHVIVAALMKTCTLRPKMNRFIANSKFYQRNEVSASFVVKKQFTDASEEGLAFVHTVDSDTIDSIHDKIKKQVIMNRSSNKDRTSGSMDLINTLPHFVSKTVLKIAMILDRHGICPRAFVDSDPYYATVLISNLGSIKLHSGYHHLTNWGTCSVFCIIGEKKFTPIFSPDGSYEMHETLDLGLTIDERLADGYYYSKTIKLLRKLLENPELLEMPLEEEIEY